MRLVKQPEMMALPAGTLFAELRQKWVFDDLAIKGETITRDGQPTGFWEHPIAWVDTDEPTPFDGFDAMYDDPTLSFPMETAPTRHDCHNPETRYLVLESADVTTLINTITLEDADG